jgi:hypothetical protein
VLIAALNPATVVVFAFASAAGGALCMPLLVFVGIKLNLKGMRTVYAGIRQDARFYRAWALVGAALGASSSTAIAILQQAGIEDPWYGLIMIAIALVPFIAIARFLKHHRS